MTTTPFDTKITEFIAAKSWLKILLTLAMSLLGVAKGRNWFALKFGIR